MSVGKYVKRIEEKEIININQTLLNIKSIKLDLENEQNNLIHIFEQIKSIYQNDKED